MLEQIVKNLKGLPRQAYSDAALEELAAMRIEFKRPECYTLQAYPVTQQVPLQRQRISLHQN